MKKRGGRGAASDDDDGEAATPPARGGSKKKKKKKRKKSSWSRAPGKCPYCRSTSFSPIVMEHGFGLETTMEVARCNKCERTFNYVTGKSATGDALKHLAVAVGIIVVAFLVVVVMAKRR